MVTKEQLQRLNPEMAATWLVGQSAPITRAQYDALVIACRDGGAVMAGTNTHKGHVERVAAGTIQALVRRGFLVEFLSPDGGYAGRLSATAHGRLADLVML